MAKPRTIEVLTERLQEHQAVRAWSQLQPGHLEPNSIEILKCKRKSAVYRLNGIGPGGATVIAKKCRTAVAQIQRLIYEEFLPRVPVPTLRCYGFLKEPEGEFCWLFLEDASGELYSPQLAQHRALAGRWLAEMHLATLPAELIARLPVRDLGHYLQLLRACRATLLDHLARNTAVSDDDAAVLRKVVTCCDVLESHWSELEQICEVVPPGLVHGDFAAKNVRVQSAAASPALLVFDWEHGGWGVPVIDLAQFASHVLSPDLSTYCSILKRDYSQLDLRDVQRAADCGNLLRMVNEINWVNSMLKFGSDHFLPRPIATLKIYEPRLVAELRVLNWS